jgi:hypothetical protein
MQSRSGWKTKGIHILQSTKYRISIISFNIISISQFLILLFIMKEKNFEDYCKWWITFALIVNTIFLLDLIGHIVLFGFKRLKKKKKEYLIEFVLQIAAQIITIVYLTNRGDTAQVKITRLLSIVMLIRNLRLMSLMWELEDFRKITETFKRFSKPFITIMFSLYTVMFFYAVMGEFFFSGMITIETVRNANISTSKMYYLINFNDLYASMLTLFHILVVNNWNQTTDMFCIIADSRWPRLYFTTFWIICTLIMLNIVISFVLENYGSIGDEIQVNERKLVLARKLMKKFTNDDEGENELF